MRTYPLIIIDRSRLENYPHDYIVCLDKTVGFVCKITHYNTKPTFQEFLNKVHSQYTEQIMYIHQLKNGGLVMSIEDYLQQFEKTTENITRIKTLMKKCFKKYTHAEIDRTPHSDYSIANQIKQQELTVLRAKASYNELVARSSKPEADYNIALSEAILESLKKLKNGIIFLKDEI